MSCLIGAFEQIRMYVQTVNVRKGKYRNAATGKMDRVWDISRTILELQRKSHWSKYLISLNKGVRSTALG